MKGKKHHGKHRKGGGEVWAGGNPDVEHEAEEKKRGGRAKAHEKKKRGGKIEGKAARHHLGRPGRRRGGKVGADLAPLSSASRSSGVGHQAETQSGPKSPD